MGADMSDTVLIPPDRERCQCERANKTWSPFNFGPADVDPKTGEKKGGSVHSDRTWRCREAPVVIVTETESDDGILGSMSLCQDCFVVLCLERGGTFRVTEDLGFGKERRNSMSGRLLSLRDKFGDVTEARLVHIHEDGTFIVVLRALGDELIRGIEGDDMTIIYSYDPVFESV
jgi:hypothetical protein